MDNVKPGWKTTEFWMSLAAMIIGALLASGAFADGSMVAKILGGAMAAMSGLGYTASRAKVKSAEAPAPSANDES